MAFLLQGRPRFRAVLRIDPLLNSIEQSCDKLRSFGYSADPALSSEGLSEIRRFLQDWAVRMKPLYLAASLPPDFAFPEESPRARVVRECILPVCRDSGLPFAMMIGVKKLVNPALRLAGDSVGKSRIETVEHLCESYRQQVPRHDAPERISMNWRSQPASTGI